jgi:hypothetical protein
MESRTGLDYGARRLHACAMPGDSREVTPLRPASVAVHDDGDVLREPARIQISEQAFFFAAGWFERVRCLHEIIPANST